MTTLETVALSEWRVTFTMTAGKARRVFVETIPATSGPMAVRGAEEIALGIWIASGHVWKMTGKATAELVTS